MEFRANLAQIASIANRLQPRILIQKLISIILCFIGDLRLPRMNLPSPMFVVWLKWRHFIRIVMSSHRHLNETLFNVLL